MLRLTTLMLIAFSLCPLSEAALRWENTLAEIKADEGIDEVVGNYHFRNDGTDTVHFSQLDPDCPCMELEAKPMVVKPGESGAVTIHFHTGGKTGDLTNFAQIETDADPNPVRLVIKAHIVPALSFDTQLLRWDANGTNDEAQLIHIKPNSARSIKFISVVSRSELFEASAKIDKDEWVLSIKPTSLGRRDTSRITLKAEVDGTLREYHCYATLR